MLPIDRSPLYAVVHPWSHAPLPVDNEDILARRQALFQAAMEELTISYQSDRVLANPVIDPIFVWGNQWLDVASGTRPRIESDVSFLFSVRTNPKPFLEQDLDAIPTDDEPDPGEPTIPFPGS